MDVFKQSIFVSLIIFQFFTFNKEYTEKYDYATILWSISMDPSDYCLMYSAF